MVSCSNYFVKCIEDGRSFYENSFSLLLLGMLFYIFMHSVQWCQYPRTALLLDYNFLSDYGEYRRVGARGEQIVTGY